METARVRILSLKKVQLDVSSNQSARVLKSVERQISNNEKLLAREHARFEAVRAKVMREKEKACDLRPQPSIQARVFSLVQNAATIKQGRDQLQRGQIVLQQRKENGSRVLAVLKKRGELINGELRKQKVKGEERREARDLEYAASVHSLIAAGARNNPANSSSPVSTAVIALPVALPGQPFRLSESVQPPDAPGPSPHLPVPRQDPGSSESSVMTVSYAAKDGSTFEVEVGASGKSLQVCVLPQEEKDRRLLRLQRADISEALAARGYKIRRFDIAGGRKQEHC